MKVIKNCLNCKYCVTQYYQENICCSPKVAEPYYDRFGNACGSQYPTTHEVHPVQHEDCIYFKLGFIAKLAIFKSKCCAWVYSKFNKKGKKQI